MDKFPILARWRDRRPLPSLLKPGEISGPIDTNSTGVVLAVVEKQEPTDQDFAAKKDQIRDSLLQTKQSELFGLFVSNLREQMEKSGQDQDQRARTEKP